MIVMAAIFGILLLFNIFHHPYANANFAIMKVLISSIFYLNFKNLFLQKRDVRDLLGFAGRYG
jgi:hypothetical protein